MRAALLVWQSFYCDGNHARCERLRLSQSGLSVPERLLPNGRLLDLPADADADADGPARGGQPA